MNKIVLALWIIAFLCNLGVIAQGGNISSVSYVCAALMTITYAAEKVINNKN